MDSPTGDEENCSDADKVGSVLAMLSRGNNEEKSESGGIPDHNNDDDKENRGECGRTIL